jgi:hypothetical protein
MKQLLSKLLFICILSLGSTIKAATVYGTMSGGTPTVTISFTALNTSINTEAVNNGFTSGSLISYQIINETSGWVFKFKYQILDATSQTSTLTTSIPLVLSGSNFEEDVQIVNGGRKVTTCKKTNCSEGCELMDQDCVPACPANPDGPAPTCEKTQTNGGSSGGPAWIGVFISVLNFLRSLQ